MEKISINAIAPEASGQFFSLRWFYKGRDEKAKGRNSFKLIEIAEQS